jgi:hypothetical protein
MTAGRSLVSALASLVVAPPELPVVAPPELPAVAPPEPLEPPSDGLAVAPPLVESSSGVAGGVVEESPLLEAVAESAGVEQSALWAMAVGQAMSAAATRAAKT